jgi:peptidoglycan/xylan/chitin deacetylase (PgdA/CDA1 family)
MRRVFFTAGHLVPSGCLNWLQRATNRYVILPYYHMVSDTPQPHVYPLYRHRTVTEFCADLDWLSAHYKPIRWDEIDACERAKQPAFCLTFDDGFKEFYTIVAPILEEKRIPCVCFLNSDFVDNKDLMFRNKEALEKLGIDWKTYLRNEQPYMTTSQIRELQERGFEFGSHSVNHPHFYQLSIDEQLTQTTACFRELKEKFHLRHRLFSLPFGREFMNETAVKVHMGTHEAVFDTANMRPHVKNWYNRIWMEDTSENAKQIIFDAYLRELGHKILRH